MSDRYFCLLASRNEMETVHTATGICQTDTSVCLLAGMRWRLYIQQQAFVRQQYLSDKCLLLYVQS